MSVLHVPAADGTVSNLIDLCRPTFAVFDVVDQLSSEGWEGYIRDIWTAVQLSLLHNLTLYSFSSTSFCSTSARRTTALALLRKVIGTPIAICTKTIPVPRNMFVPFNTLWLKF